MISKIGCIVGDADSLGLLGWSYEYGIGTEQDYARAVEYYRCAAEKGNASSMNNLAEMLANGRGGPRNFEQAMFWYQRAAEAGSVCALYNMGWHAEQAGRIAEALDCYRQAQQSGDEAAFWALGRFYEIGIGVEQDPKQAFALYQAGAEKGNVNCRCRLIRCYALGIGTPRDPDMARQLGRALLCEKLDPWDLEDYGCQPELEQLRQLMDTLET